MKQKAIRISPWAPSDLWSGDMAAVTIGGLFMLVLGIWAFFAPASFADFVAFPYNRHLLHDVGAFQIGIGTTMLLALMWTVSWSCWPDTLWVPASTWSPTSSTGTSVATPTIRWC
jgi:hypothetical protein